MAFNLPQKELRESQSPKGRVLHKYDFGFDIHYINNHKDYMKDKKERDSKKRITSDGYMPGNTRSTKSYVK